MCDHIANGKLPTVPHNRTKDSINGIGNGGTPSPHPLTLKPQISIEQVDFGDGDGSGGSKESTPGPDLPLTSNDRLMVDYKKHKSNSLPTGLMLEESYRASMMSVSTEGVNSDLSDDLESTMELDSSVDIDKELVLISPSKAKRGPRPKKQLVYTESLSSVTSMTSELNDSELSSDEDLDDKGLDDEVFNDSLYNKCFDTDVKLVEWACQEFVPLCQTLLQRCASEDIEGKSEQVQFHLRNLSNRINYFCSEQHSKLKAILLRGITSSISTDFTRITSIDRSHIQSPSDSLTTTSTSPETPSGNRESGESQYDHRSYAVKVLRNVSHSLINPLLKEAESGFSKELYHAIVQAIQKIALKVEACLSYNDPTKQFNIHAQIFSPSETERVKEMMICMALPEESTIQSAARSRSSSASDYKSPTTSPKHALLSDSDAQRVIKRTPSGRIRPGGTVFDSGSLPEDFKAKLQKSEPVSMSSNSDSQQSGDATPLAHSIESSPTKFRGRTATEGDASVSESWNSKPLSHYGSTPFIDSDGFPIPGADFGPEYLRPKARRTTVSLSRKEVTRLGLTVAKNVDEAIATTTTLVKSGEGHTLNEETSEERVHPKSDNELEGSSPITPHTRFKSASLSNILDDSPSPVVARQHDSKIRKPSLEIEVSHTPTSAGLPNYKRSVRKKSKEGDPFAEGDWEYIKGHQVDPRVARGFSKKSLLDEDSPSSKKAKKSKKNRKDDKKKASSEKSTSSSRFTLNLKKTAQALRRMSTVSKSSRTSLSATIGVGSLDLLSDTDRDLSRPSSSLSEPPSPHALSRSLKSDTMPNHKKRTFFRGSGGKSHSKSFSKTDSLARKKKGQRSGFLDGYHDTSPGGGFTDTIDLQYSEQVEVERQEDGEGVRVWRV